MVKKCKEVLEKSNASLERVKYEIRRLMLGENMEERIGRNSKGGEEMIGRVRKS